MKKLKEKKNNKLTKFKIKYRMKKFKALRKLIEARHSFSKLKDNIKCNLKNNLKKKENKKSKNNLLEKAKNKNKLRVIYKAPGRDPEVKIIPNVFILKKAIINRNLEIIPYQNVFMVFNKQKEIQKEPINIILDMCNIKGDLLIVQIDKEKREFESLSQEDIIWFTEDLTNKSPVKNNVINMNEWKAQNQNSNKLTKKQIKDYYSKELTLFDAEEKAANSVNFEQNLINVLTNIELNLANLLENKKN